jgi:Protein of unknown function (DUF1778)
MTSFRVNDDDRALIQRAAAAERRSMASFITIAALDRAAVILRNPTIARPPATTPPDIEATDFEVIPNTADAMPEPPAKRTTAHPK